MSQNVRTLYSHQKIINPHETSIRSDARSNEAYPRWCNGMLQHRPSGSNTSVNESRKILRWGALRPMSNTVATMMYSMPDTEERAPKRIARCRRGLYAMDDNEVVCERLDLVLGNQAGCIKRGSPISKIPVIKASYMARLSSIKHGSAVPIPMSLFACTLQNRHRQNNRRRQVYVPICIEIPTSFWKEEDFHFPIENRERAAKGKPLHAHGSNSWGHGRSEARPSPQASNSILRFVKHYSSALASLSDGPTLHPESDVALQSHEMAHQMLIAALQGTTSRRRRALFDADVGFSPDDVSPANNSRTMPGPNNRGFVSCHGALSIERLKANPVPVCMPVDRCRLQDNRP
ncbi:hypothetical protein E4U43_002606 [Claviceps pusilla]|uniref:Uncharacterized protein n=1 Tax=Claviceps pusilla TaxID=123648 RepID=A0A9P7N8M8_9HYPO|nr:hypothetical protein E4U43_002606 [Claviceps pusilla]